MALYNNGFPANYPQYYSQFQQQYIPQNVQNINQQQVQNGGFISVRNEQEARAYPVAPGNSITFKDETAPYVYTKSMGFSPLDRPTFEKFRLVKEQDAPETAVNASNPGVLPESDKLPAYDAKPEIEALQKELEAHKMNMDNFEAELEDLRGKIADFICKKPEVRRKRNEPE